MKILHCAALTLAGSLTVSLAGCAVRPASLPLGGSAAAVPTASGKGFIYLDQGGPVGYLEIHLGQQQARSVQSFPSTVAQFVLTVTAPDMVQAVTATVPLVAGSTSASASLTVPVGSGRTLSVKAEDAAGVVVAMGSSTALTVSSGTYSPVTVGLVTTVGNIAGSVFDRDTTLPVSGATVAADGITTTTNASGDFTLQDVASGSTSVQYSDAGYTSGSLVVSVAAASTSAAPSEPLTMQHWVEQISGTSATLIGVKAVSATEAWAWGSSGTLLETTDGGQTWIPVASGTAADIEGLVFVDSMNGFFVSTGGLYGTTDGGSAWSLGNSNDWGYGLAAGSAQDVWVGGNGSQFKASTNGGVTFNQYSAAVSGLSMVSNSTFFGIDINDSNVYKSTSGGTSWSQLSGTGNTDYPYGYAQNMLAAVDVNTCYEVGYTVPNGIDVGNVVETLDGGSSWQKVFTTPPSQTAYTFNAIVPYGSGGWCAVGNDGAAAVDFPSTGWTEVPIIPSDPTDYQLNGVSFAGTAGWAVGNNGKILKY